MPCTHHLSLACLIKLYFDYFPGPGDPPFPLYVCVVSAIGVGATGHRGFCLCAAST